MPVLCFNGTRDAFCEPSLMKSALEKVKTRWTMHWVAEADHGFKVPKRTGRTEAEVMHEISSATAAWLTSLAPRTG